MSSTAGLGMVKEVKVGIFWVLPGNKLLIHSIPWTKALSSKEGELSNDWLNFSRHVDFWENYCKTVGLQDVEYTDHPRGRVVYKIATKKAKLFLGSKIAKNKKLVKRIAKAFNLIDPAVVLDEHYEDLLSFEAEEFE